MSDASAAGVQLGHLPVPGESITYDGRKFIVAEMAGRRIARVRVEALTPEPAAALSS